MRFSGIKVGFALTGSHCTIDQVLPIIQLLKNEGADITPILSPAVSNTDTRFGKAQDLQNKLLSITGKTPLTTLDEVEPIGPKKLFNTVIVAPCTGNTLAKLTLGISDTSVSLACKAQLRNSRPVILAISSNDALSTNARNLGILLNKKYIFFVPFGQDAPQTKQTSLVAKMEYIPETMLEALAGRQIQPVIVSY